MNWIVYHGGIIVGKYDSFKRAEDVVACCKCANPAKLVTIKRV